MGWSFDTDTRISSEYSYKTLCSVSSPLMSEALALCEALMLAKRSLLFKVWFWTDSQELIRAMNSKSYPVELYGVLTDIESISSLFISPLFSYIPRSQNMIADSLAKRTLRAANSTLY